jgi:phosphorylcholine metabolism protein LicD
MIIIIIILYIIILFFILIKINTCEKLSNKDIELSSKLTQDEIKNIKLGQDKILNMMKIFHNLCVKNNIRYMIGYGNLLGAILYNGWVPWDGDFDIMIDKDDYDKLRNILINDLPKDMWYQDNLNDLTYKTKSISKIRDLNSCYYTYKNKSSHNGLQIDLTKYTFVNNLMITYDSNKLKTITYDDVYPLKLYKYEDTEFYVPNNYNKFLNEQYGNDWDKILPIEKRRPHEGLIDPYNACDHHKNIYPNL